MKFLDHTADSPQANLDFDEQLLKDTDTNSSESSLRIWESPTYFVVLGLSNKAEREAYPDRCQADGIPILKRASGGGTVLQGPGCLNYSLVLNVNEFKEAQNLNKTTSFVLEKNKKSILKNLADIEVKGISDLTFKGKKFSGNAQRRLKKAVLFHGTFLYDFDLNLIPKYLQMPSKEPDYRKGKSHLDFVTNLPINKAAISQALIEAWIY